MNKNIHLNSDEDYTFIDFTPIAKGKALTKGKISIFARPVRVKNGRRDSAYNAFRINAVDAAHLQRLGLDMLRLRRDNLTGELYLVFNSTVGLKLKFEQNARSAVIASGELVEYLANWAGAKPDGNGITRAELEISDDLSNSPDFATFHILRPIDMN